MISIAHLILSVLTFCHMSVSALLRGQDIIYMLYVCCICLNVFVKVHACALLEQCVRVRIMSVNTAICKKEELEAWQQEVWQTGGGVAH